MALPIWPSTARRRPRRRPTTRTPPNVHHARSPTTSRLRPAPAAGLALVRAAEEGERRAPEDLQVDAPGAVLDGPHVQLDPLGPGQGRAAVDLRPAGDPREDVEAATLAVGVLLDLVAQRRSGADHGHVPPDDVPELRQLVERQPPQHAADAGDARIALVHGPPRALRLRADDHRAQLQQLEVTPVLADARLPVEDGAAVLELDRRRGDRQQGARDGETSRGRDDVQLTPHGAKTIR